MGRLHGIDRDMSSLPVRYRLALRRIATETTRNPTGNLVSVRTRIHTSINYKYPITTPILYDKQTKVSILDTKKFYLGAVFLSQRYKKLLITNLGCVYYTARGSLVSFSLAGNGV